ncbi:MAG: hypothetical protein OEQ53_13840 [Saprospiraceae bacterium]|nr:hypothetical protein [Saprospiraceae bacterium]
MIRRLLLYGFLLLAGLNHLLAQAEKPKNWLLTGYAKHLQTVLAIDGLNGYLVDNLLHNRLNFKAFPSDEWTFTLEIRNRMFYGDLVKLDPNYAQQIEAANNDFIDLSLHWVDQDDWVFNSTIDRVYVEWTKGNLETRLGRQRINWGISTVWNPNDLFNAFSFTDFDYEERPGSDAFRLRYYTGHTSSIEFAVSAGKTWNSRVAAALFKWNISQYDFQILSGVANNEFVIGGGWAGNIKNSGFKGEWTYFIPLEKGENSFAATGAFDHLFDNSLYLNLGYLYNSNGTTSGSLSNLFFFELSAKNLYPFRHAIFVMNSYPVTPLFNVSLAWIYSPVSSHPLFVNPTMTYSIAQSWDLDLVTQLAFSKEGGNYESPVKAVFLRFKVSF